MLAYFFNFPWPILLVYVSGLFFHTERKYVYYGAGWRYKEIYTLLALEYTVWFVILLLIHFCSHDLIKKIAARDTPMRVAAAGSIPKNGISQRLPTKAPTHPPAKSAA